MASPLVALFETPDDAAAAVADLRAAGFPERAIGTVMPVDVEDVRQPRLEDVAPHDVQSGSTASAAAGSVLGGAFGAILAATGVLVIPGVGPFITGGILVTLVGGAAGWLVGGLVGMDVPREEAAYYEARVQGGKALVTLLPEGREILASEILRRHKGDLSAATVAWNIAMGRNRAEASGQIRDMRPTLSDDGTVPPTDVREAITLPAADRSKRYLKGASGAGDRPHVIESPEKEPRDAAGAGRRDAAGGPPTSVAAKPEVGLSPGDPHRESDQGTPYLDDANPYGRPLDNRQGKPIGGTGTVEHPEDPAVDADNSARGRSSPEAFPESIERQTASGDRRQQS